MEGRKSYLLRVDPQVLEAVRRWADDELRSLNGQIEFILRQALKERGRLRDGSAGESPVEGPER
ncbi:MAG: Arc family DNA-binding protein [Bryobacteraceae bacterium]|nr:Arc family DNA-binding protein [Bryobacteraceae bacterium]